MFRKLGDLIHRTSWFALIGGGLFVLVGLVLFAAPIHLLRMSETGRTPAERSAIKREINLAFGDRALTIAESVVKSMKARSGDPERIRDLNAALGEMERARREIERARSDVGRATGAASAGAREAARAAAQAALEMATQSAESAVEAATDAREAIEQARDDAIERLKDKGIDTAATRKSFDQLLKGARENERNARESLAAIRALPRRADASAAKSGSRSSAPPAAPAAPDDPADLPAGPPPPPSSRSTTRGSASPDSASAAAAADATDAAFSASRGDDAGGHPSSGLSIREDGRGRTHPVIVIDGTEPKKKGIAIHIDTNDRVTPGLVLPPEVRRDIRNKVEGDVWRVGVGSAMILVFVPLFMMLLIAKYLIGRSRRALAFAEEKKQEAEVSDINRQITEARLQALQAQIEPHFLYNTLANVQALTEFDPPAANAMVGHLIQYLRAALPKMRESTSTVGQEVELVRAYLNILKMRMGARLEFGIELPESLARRPFPPMMLPSLVENAIKHGLEPVREGGRIDVVVTQVSVDGRDRVRVEVRDTGRGMSGLPPTAGGGVGLTNLRERLNALHGAGARFKLEPNDPHGAIATIEVPLEAVATAGATADPAARAAAEAGAAGSFTATAATAQPLIADGPAPKGWRRMWRATSRTHSLWASIMSKLFFVLMFILAVAFALSLAALYSGWMPMIFGNQELEGIEGKALGSVLLLGGFLVAALAVAVVVAAFYGLGFVFAALIVVVPAAILVFLFPFLAPFIVVALIVWWFLRRRRRRRLAAAAATTQATGTAADSAKITGTSITDSVS
jgi:hypothetical protein